MRVFANVCFAAALWSASLSAQTVVAPVAALTPTQPLGQYGQSVALDGDVLVVGAILGDSPNFPNGAAQVFERISGTWTQTATLVPPSFAAPIAGFGTSVAVAGDVIAVGFPAMPFGNQAGAGGVCVFVRSALGWSQATVLREPTPTFQAQFGEAVDITRVNNMYRIAALADPLPFGHAGRVHVFDFNGTTATFDGSINGAEASLAIDGDLVVTGYSVPGSGVYTDEVRVHRRTASGWNLVAQLLPSDPQAINGFGTSVAVANGRILVGNPQAGTFIGTGVGAYVFERATLGWTETAILRGDNDPSDFFGWSVALDGERAVIGAITDATSDGVGTPQRGAAWLYEHGASGWRAVTKIIPRDAGEHDYVGSDVAIDGDTFVFTRIQSYFSASHDGVAYVYSATAAGSNPFRYCSAGSTSNGCTPTMGWSGTPSASATSGFVLSATNAPGQRGALLLYGVTGQLYYESPGASSVLCVNTPRQRTRVLSTQGTGGACEGSYALDWSLWTSSTPLALGLPLYAGQRVNAQVWIRDPATLGGPVGMKHLVMSDAVEFELGP